MDGPYFKIGEFAQLMGVSPDALRYFEDRGVLVPERDPVNGYRYYGIECSPKMTRFRLLRACGLTYEQTLEPACSIGAPGFPALLDGRLGEIERSIARLNCERNALNEYKALSQRILAEPDFLSIEQIERTFYFYLQFCNDDAVNDKERQPVIRTLVAALPLSFFAVLPDRLSVFQETEEDRDLYGAVIDERYIPLLDEPELFTHPDRVIRLHTVCRFVYVVKSGELWPVRFRQVRDHLLTLGYQVSGDPLIRILPEYVQSTASCMEVFLPIQALSAPQNEKKERSE